MDNGTKPIVYPGTTFSFFDNPDNANGVVHCTVIIPVSGFIVIINRLIDDYYSIIWFCVSFLQVILVIFNVLESTATFGHCMKAWV